MEYPRLVNALVITGGGAPEVGRVIDLLDAADVIVAADSGLATARRFGVRPSLIVGDFDSIGDLSVLDEYDDAEVRRFPAAKDATDTEIALDAAWGAGASRVSLIGGGGGRMDHLLAIVAVFERDRFPHVWVTSGEIVKATDDELVEHGTVGEGMSLFPLGCEPCRMRSTGLRWPLDSLVWHRGDIGISNEFAEAEVCITVDSGRLLMVRRGGNE
jgi:thiamine pyrophosphokinase